MNQQAYQREYYQRRIKAGCIDCGKPKGKGATLTRCAECKKSHRKQNNERYQRRLAA